MNSITIDRTNVIQYVIAIIEPYNLFGYRIY